MFWIAQNINILAILWQYHYAVINCLLNINAPFLENIPFIFLNETQQLKTFL